MSLSASRRWLRAVGAQTRVELLLTWRRGESVLITIVLPVLLLWFLGSVELVPTTQQRRLDFLLPGMLALAVMANAMVSLGIATAFERHYGVLKRLGGSPLPRSGLVAAKVLAVLGVEVVQVVLLIALAAGVFAWRPPLQAWLTLPMLLGGTAAFAGLGLALAGAWRAEVVLAGANGLFVVFLLIGDLIVPLSALPAIIGRAAAVLPPAVLAAMLRGALTPGGSVAAGDVLLLLGWAIAMPCVAAATFKWE